MKCFMQLKRKRKDGLENFRGERQLAEVHKENKMDNTKRDLRKTRKKIVNQTVRPTNLQVNFLLFRLG